ncbi:MAG: hypothetical protein ACRDD8_10520 [Bacteroidales bacterium]
MYRRLSLSKKLEDYFEEISYYDALKNEMGVALSKKQKNHISKIVSSIKNSAIYLSETRICDVWINKSLSLVN